MGSLIANTIFLLILIVIALYDLKTRIIHPLAVIALVVLACSALPLERLCLNAACALGAVAILLASNGLYAMICRVRRGVEAIECAPADIETSKRTLVGIGAGAHASVGIGAGDIKLIAACALYLGINIFETLVCTALLGLITACAVSFVRKAKLDQTFAFAPSIVGGVLIVILGQAL